MRTRDVLVGLCWLVAFVEVVLHVGACGSEPSSPSCSVDVTRYERGTWKPGAPIDSGELPTDVPDNTLLERIRFDGDVQGALTTYLLPDQGDVTLRYTLSVGAHYPGLRDARFVAFLDGVQLMQRDPAGDDALALPVHAEPGKLTEVVSTLRDELIADGAHSLVLAILRSDNGTVVSGQLLTVIRGPAQFDARSVDAIPTKADRNAWFPVLSEGWPVPINIAIPTISETGALPLTIPLHRSEDAECAHLAVATVAMVLVDFEQVPLDGFDHPFVRAAPKAGEVAAIDVHALAPPPSEHKHVLTVLAYEGDGAFTEAPPGSFAPGSSIAPYTLASGFY